VKVGDLVCWEHDMMKGHPDDALLVVIEIMPLIANEAHVRVVSPLSGWTRTCRAADLEVVSSQDH